MKDVDEIIARTRAFHAKEGVVFPENIDAPSEEDFQQILANHQNDLTYRELKEAINKIWIPINKYNSLRLCIYIGRGDFTDCEESFAEAEAGWTNRTAEYLPKPQLADHLEAGLDAMDYHREDDESNIKAFHWRIVFTGGMGFVLMHMIYLSSVSLPLSSPLSYLVFNHFSTGFIKWRRAGCCRYWRHLFWPFI